MKALFLLFLALALGDVGRAQSYDPLAVATNEPATLDLTVHDAARSRDIPLRVYLPTNAAPVPVVLFSPGLGGSRATDPFLGRHWAARGYVAVFLQHPGSDDAVWKDAGTGGAAQAMARAASPVNLLLRVQDVPMVLNQLAIWNAQAANPLAGRMELNKIGMSGHSFGAVTTEVVGGEALPKIGRRFTDPRITAALAFSPSAPQRGSPAAVFGLVKIPWMLMTGTRDNSPIGQADAASRRTVYPALKLAPRYELVLDRAEHSAFTDRALPGDREPRNPNHHRVMLALSTAFWDAYLRDDREARAWLNGSGPRALLEKADQWQCATP
jgi:dienelactone hydrolase